MLLSGYEQVLNRINGILHHLENLTIVTVHVSRGRISIWASAHEQLWASEHVLNCSSHKSYPAILWKSYCNSSCLEGSYEHLSMCSQAVTSRCSTAYRMNPPTIHFSLSWNPFMPSLEHKNGRWVTCINVCTCPHVLLSFGNKSLSRNPKLKKKDCAATSPTLRNANSLQ